MEDAGVVPATTVTASPKKRMWLWALYDFANSLAFVNVSYYFALWFVDDRKGGDVWISVAVALSTILMVFTAPVFGRMSDKTGRRMPSLKVFTYLSIACLFLLGIAAVNIGAMTFGSVAVIVVLYFLFNYFYQMSLTFYNAFLVDIAGADLSREKISGFGMSVGQLGNVIGLLLVFPLALGKVSLFGASGRSATFLMGALLFLLFVIPTFLWLKDSAGIGNAEKNKFGKSFGETLDDIKRIRQYPGVLPYLFTFYFFADAVLTLQLFGVFYVVNVGGLSNGQAMAASILNLGFGVIGAWLSPAVAKLFKGTRRAIGVSILLWAVFIAALAFARTSVWNLIIFAGGGYVFGTLFALSRAFYSNLVPREKHGEFFGVYVLFERTSSILGPLVWSATALAFGFLGNDRYRYSMLSLAVLVLISAVIFRFVKEPKPVLRSLSQ